MELDRKFIERNDFAAVRRGYDPDEVDSHLRAVADAVAELQRERRPSSPSLALDASDQVRAIVEAAEASASQIHEQAEADARRITEEAKKRASKANEEARADALERVQRAEEAAQKIVERAGAVESEMERLVEELRSATGSVTENLRSGASQLQVELTSIREEYATIREARLEESGGDGRPAAPEEDSGPVDAEPEVVAEVEETAPETPAESAAEEEPEPEEEAAGEKPGARGARSGSRSIRGAEGARLIALNMALNGTPRDETARYLEDNFDLDDQDALLDEVYARVGD